MIADGERGDHGARRNLERFNHKLPDEQSDDGCDQKRLDPFLVK
jgi:hypothetical protein